MDIRSEIEELRQQLKSVAPAKAPPAPPAQPGRGDGEAAPAPAFQPEQSTQRRRLAKLESLKEKIERKVDKTVRTRRHYEGRLAEAQRSEDPKVGVLLSELNARLFDGKGLTSAEDICLEVERLDVDSLNVELFVQDFLGSESVAGLIGAAPHLPLNQS